jgi:lipoprotein-anchoring transpeptidase ErfK/SrfK
VLYIVRDGQVKLISPVSTAGLPGRFTPVGTFSIYRKVDGYDPSPLGILYKPMYFTGGYAIHGNPSVPPYPASHGCIRVPNFVIERLFTSEPYGETVYVY